FLTGTDEHGIKMLQTARKLGKEPRALADEMTPKFKEMVRRLGCSNDDFIRTTEPRHHAASQAIWRRMAAKGDIYLATYAGWYSVRDEAYYDESELAVGEDGAKVSPQGTPVEWVEEDSYFFRLSAYRDRLLALYEDNPHFIRPASRRNEVISFVRAGLRDLSMSRTTFDWGIRVPDSPGHVIYVWVDALTNYLTALGFPDESSIRYQRFWPADLHVIGKDIVRFHAVYWPAFLMSADLALPHTVFGHGFLLNKGAKMSKSTGNVLDPLAMADDYGVDPLRYFFLREVPFGQDGSYSHDAIVNRINADLANDFGNLAQRCLSMIAKNCQGRVPMPADLRAVDKSLLRRTDDLLEEVRATMADYAIHSYLEAVWKMVGEANAYFASQAPWALKTSEPERMATVLYVTAEVVRQLAILAQPAMPSACATLLDQLGIAPQARDFAALGDAGRLTAGAALPAPHGVFPRYRATQPAEA
ncbi:MAG: methionine--tRNA ligase, partial [Alphaproteobacteria bacterium]